MKYLGLDAHSSTCTLACLSNRGKRLGYEKFSTSAKNLISAVTAIKGKKILAVEESHLAAWVKATVSPYVDKLVVCDPKHNKWISHDDHADDKVDATKLADLLRGGYLKEIYHPDEKGECLRSLFLHYYDLNHQIVRFKCKLKAEFRQLAIPTKGGGIYNPKKRSEWLALLEGKPYVQLQVNQDFQMIDMLEKMKVITYAKMVQLAKKDKAFSLLCSIPGVGNVVATGYLALIVTPYRFSRKNKLWRYGGFSNQVQESDGVTYKDRPTRTGNRVLKWVVIQQFIQSVLLSSETNRFRKRYHKMVTHGKSSQTAKRAVCRDILATVRAVWMKGETYRALS